MPAVRVAGTDVEIQAKPGEAILAALSRNGYAHTYGCRRGGCGVCKVELVAGTVTYPTRVAVSVLSEDERHGGTCLSCRGVPEGDVVIRLRPEDRLHCVAPMLAALGAKASGSVSTIDEGH